jgi:hypothetical protein
VFARFWQWLAHRQEEDVLPPHPPAFPKLSEEELDQHKKELAAREATLRAIEARARVRYGKRK